MISYKKKGKTLLPVVLQKKGKEKKKRLEKLVSQGTFSRKKQQSRKTFISQVVFPFRVLLLEPVCWLGKGVKTG